MLKFHEMGFGPRLPIVPPSNASAVVVRSQGMPNFQQVRSLGRTRGGSALLHGGECSSQAMATADVWHGAKAFAFSIAETAPNWAELCRSLIK